MVERMSCLQCGEHQMVDIRQLDGILEVLCSGCGWIYLEVDTRCQECGVRGAMAVCRINGNYPEAVCLNCDADLSMQAKL